MTMYDADGVLITKATFPATADPDPLMVVDENVFEREPYGEVDPKPEGTLLKVKFKKGQVVHQSWIDREFKAATIELISPNTGATGGGDDVTITGTNLTGVTQVTFGGTPGTNLEVLSETELVVTTPSGSGAVDVAVVDDSGTVTETGGFTYA